MAMTFGMHRPVVLVADGHDDTRALYRLVLADMAASIDEASDGVEAYGRALSRRPDLLVTEQRLAHMDGLALVRRLRADPRNRDCAVLVVTSGVSEETREQLLDAGVGEILLKPCDSVTLVSAAQRLTWRANCIEPDGLFGAGGSCARLLATRRTRSSGRREARRLARTS
jgi:CheY-like chemotaxis protein